jgi:hypothetical protein
MTFSATGRVFKLSIAFPKVVVLPVRKCLRLFSWSEANREIPALLTALALAVSKKGVAEDVKVA